MKSLLFAFTLFLYTSNAVAQDSQYPVSIFDPANPSPISSFTEEELFAELQRRQVRAARDINDLDLDQIDKLVLDRLSFDLINEPKVVKARLDLSDIQLNELQKILDELRDLKLEYQANQINEMCSRWNSLRASQSITEDAKISDTLAAFDEKGEQQANSLYSRYQDAISDIREMLGNANSIVFDSYLESSRKQAARTSLISFTQSLNLFGSAKESIQSHCR